MWALIIGLLAASAVAEGAEAPPPRKQKNKNELALAVPTLAGSSGCGEATPREWSLYVPDYLDRDLEGAEVSLQPYDEREPGALLRQLHANNASLNCFPKLGVAFPRTGSSWARLASCIEEHEGLDYTVVNTDLTVADCKKICMMDAATEPLYTFCGLLDPDALPLSAPIPQFVLLHTGKPVTDFYKMIAAAGVKAATFGAGGALIVPGSERVCSVEAVASALFLASGRKLHTCTAEDALGDRVVKFAAGAAQRSRDSTSEERITILGVVVVGSGLLVAFLAGINTVARDYPALVSLSVNTVSSVSIIFINKIIYQRGFKYVVTLGGLNFLATASVRLCARKQSPKDGDISRRDMIIFTVLNTGALSTSNLSLFFNSVGFYQISKLMLMPATVVVERLGLGKRHSTPVVACVAVVIVGVALTTVSSVSVNAVGLFIAMAQVCLAASMQVFTFRVQQKYSMPPDVFIAQTAWIQGAVLLVLGPLVDRAMQGSWVFDLFAGGDPTFPGTLFYVVLSSAVAIAVNVSQAAAIGAASALAFQVLGHTKTIAVLIIAFIFFDSHWTPKSLCGAGLALCGIVAYGIIRNREAWQKPAKAGKDDSGPAGGVAMAGEVRDGAKDGEDEELLGQTTAGISRWGGEGGGRGKRGTPHSSIHSRDEEDRP